MSKEDLLKELSELGVNPSSGRKIRTDKGKTRGPNSQTRSDKGTTRLTTKGVSKPALSIYLTVRSRMLNRSASDNTGIFPDINNIFMLMTRENRAINQAYSVTHRATRIFRTVKHVQGYDVDLEKYRFEAIQSKLFEGEIPPHYRPAFMHEITQYNTTDWLELFCRLYHVTPEESIRWSYQRWREHYLIVCDTVLSDEFKFSYKHKPGSAEFMPEFSEQADALQHEITMKVISSKKYKDYRAQVRDKIYTRELMKIRQELLQSGRYDNCSMEQVNKMAKDIIDEKQLEAQIEHEMSEWLTDKLIRGDIE